MLWIIIGSAGFVLMLAGLGIRLRRGQSASGTDEEKEIASLIVPWFGS